MLKIWMNFSGTIFKRGFRTKICCCFYQSITTPKWEMSVRSLQQRLHDMGLKRRNISYNIQEIRQQIVKNLNGLGCSGGYRLHWRGPQVERYSSTTTSGGRALSWTRPCWLSWKKGSPPTEGPVYESCRINWNRMVFLYMGVLTDSVEECFG